MLPTREFPVLMLHNQYTQPGGEDQVFTAEGNLLEANGHRVLRYTVHNELTGKMSSPALLEATLWNRGVYREVRRLIRRERPAVAHFHNTFPLVSPAAYYAARAERVPVIQTLHNYRLLCPNALFFRDGGVCEDCMGRTIPLPGVAHACYRGSYTASAASATMLTLHRLAGTWKSAVNAYITLTKFARSKFIDGGFSADKLYVKPNFLDTDPGFGEGRGGYFLFVGRLSEEKGVRTMLEAWRNLKVEASLKVVGTGPLESEVREFAYRIRGVEYLGGQSKERVLSLMKDAAALVFPSLWYEGFPMVIAESYAVGLPVISSNIGSMSSLISDGRTGLHFIPGNSGDLASAVENFCRREPGSMRLDARREFEENYTAQTNYRILTNIYGRFITESATR